MEDAPFAFPGGLMTIFSTVVQASTGFDEHMLNVRQLGDLRLGSWVATQLVGDDLARHLRTSHQYAFEESLRRLVAAFLKQNVELGAMLSTARHSR